MSYNCEYCTNNYKNKSSFTKHIKICKSKIKKNELLIEKLSIEDIPIEDIPIEKLSIEDTEENNLKNFTIENYMIIINKKIQEHLKKSKYNDDILEDELLDNFIKNNPEGMKFSKKLKQLQMNAGNIWQIAIGNYNTFEDLKTSHSTGCDVKSNSRKIIIELKNRYNTDNASSKKSNFDKLVKYKKENSDWECIYGIVNDKTKEGKKEIIKHNDFEITYLSGKQLMNFIFGKDTDFIIDNVKSQMLSIKY